MPKIEARLNYPDFQTPARVYIHKGGFVEAFGSPPEPRITNARNYFIKCFRKVPEGRFDYVLAIIWGREGKPMADFFGYHDIGSWPGNPTISAWVMENGVIAPNDRSKDITCGDGIIITGLEEIYRRGTKNLEEFVHNPPQVKGLEFIDAKID